MSIFQFKTDFEGQKFCEDIAKAMTALFGISEDEAVGRINRAWKGQDTYIDSIIFHEDEDYWAKDLYYGHDSHWWLNPLNLQPTPYP